MWCCILHFESIAESIPVRPSTAGSNVSHQLIHFLLLLCLADSPEPPTRNTLFFWRRISPVSHLFRRHVPCISKFHLITVQYGLAHPWCLHLTIMNWHCPILPGCTTPACSQHKPMSMTTSHLQTRGWGSWTVRLQMTGITGQTGR